MDMDQRPLSAQMRPTPAKRDRSIGALLVDSRHPGLASDRQAWNWLVHLGVPCHVVATKVDKLSRTDRVRHLKELERLHEGPVGAVSAQTGEGLKELWKTIDALLRP